MASPASFKAQQAGRKCAKLTDSLLKIKEETKRVLPCHFTPERFIVSLHAGLAGFKALVNMPTMRRPTYFLFPERCAFISHPLLSTNP